LLSYHLRQNRGCMLYRLDYPCIRVRAGSNPEKITNKKNRRVVAGYK
jgi:hypothetical protein